jgi:hypothetical protein
MASNETLYLINKTLNHNLGIEIYTPPSSYWLGLLTDYPSQTYFQEMSGNNYGRAQVLWSASTNKVAQSSNTIQFPIPSAQWADVFGYAIYDAQTDGNAMYVVGVDRTFTPPLSAIVMQPGAISIGDLF